MVPEVTQTPLIEKQPAPRLIPLPLKVEVALLAILSAPLMVVDAPTKRLPPMYPLPLTERLVVDAPLLNVCSDDQVLAVVVPKPSENWPVPVL